MTKGKKRTTLLAVLSCVFALVFSLGIMSACGNSETASDKTGGQWLYGTTAPAENLGNTGDYYLNTETLTAYVRTADGTWQQTALYSGTGAPDNGSGAVGDLYLDTTNGILYQKTNESLWSIVVKLQGRPGRDGVVWFSGDKAPSEYEEGDMTLKDAKKGDFYLNTETFDVYQLGTDGKTWNPLGSLKGIPGESGKVVGWTVGSGAPTAETTVGAEGFYLDSSSGNIYQKSGESEWALKGSLGTLSASHIKTIEYNTRYYGKTKWGKNGTILNPENSIGGSYSTVNGDTSIYGYWFTFDNDTHLFIDAGECKHTNGYSADDRYYLYNNDCEKGTAYWHKCKFCGEWSLVTAEPTGSEAHTFNKDIWAHNESLHWHPAACSHDVKADAAEHEYIKYATLSVGDDDSVSASTYIIWVECTVCGYKYREPTLEDLRGENGAFHIATVGEWNAFATLYNANKVNTIALPRAAGVTVELDKDIDFNGASLKPIGTADHPFNGTFEGNNKTISNFTLSSTAAGLFGMTQDATVQNFNITGAEVTATGESSCAGVLVAEAKGTLTVKNVTIEESEAAKGEGVTDATVGGLVGKVTEGSVSVDTVEVDVGIDGANHSSGKEGNTLVGGGASVEFTGDNKVGYPVGEGFIEWHYMQNGTTQKVQFEISSIKGLETFRDSVNGENGLTADTYWNKTVVLMDDLDFKGFDENGNVIEKNIWWGSIGKGTFNNLGAGNTSWNGKTFSGTFDGQNHTIKNICLGYDNHANTPSSPNVHYGLYPSLFGGLVNATVKDLNFEKAEAGTAPASGPSGIGLLAMWQSGGTISNVNIDSLTLNGGGHNGGLVAVAMSGKIENCSLKNSTIKGSQYTGGLVGRGAGNFDSCKIIDCTIESSWDFVGGVIGHWGHYGTSPAEVKMTNITVTGTKLVLTARSMSRIDSAGMVVGYIHRIGDDKNGSQGKSIFETVHVSDCSIEAKAEGSLSTLDLVSVGGVAGGIGAYRPGGQGASSTTGAMRVSFKGVTVDGFTVNSDGTVSYAGGIFGGRSASMFEAARKYGDVTLSFEDCSVKGFKINAGIKFTEKNTVTQSGYFVGSLESAVVMPGYPSPENGTFTLVFTGTNTYQPTVESLTYCGMEASSYTTDGAEPTAKEGSVG